MEQVLVRMPSIEGHQDKVMGTYDSTPHPKISIESIPHLTEYLQDLPTFQNPLMNNNYFQPIEGFFVTETDMVVEKSVIDIKTTNAQFLYHRAGPRSQVWFKPEEVKAAIATCGGLCPGLNTVIRELVCGLWFQYGVRNIHGIRAGYRGFYSFDPVPLNPKMVQAWHRVGGTMLETSKGGFDLHRIVDAIEENGFNQVYLIGGDGTMKGAEKVYREVRRRGLKVCVAGIPGNVDNDMGVIERSFGFETAVETAQSAINAAAVEAESAVNGVGVVRLMGRQTGHIAIHSTLSSRDVDCCLIPEDPFYLEGEGGLFQFMESRLAENGRFVLVVAEGAGQDLIPKPSLLPQEEEDEQDESYNTDVGPWLCNQIKQWWKEHHPGELITVKFIEPTYMVRDSPASATENMFCTLLANACMHGIMAGYTGFVVGTINGMYAYVTLEKVAATANYVGRHDSRWAWVRSVTNQPDFPSMKREEDKE